ncbi:hypothetical protein LCGC14_0801610 [marine sediment metagenome]|uniref:Uncharacterized protein n=1 Tax=marine sediment metagenome TaxID=412755 RepID=A0A0F9SWL1_9ZZZZ
MENIKCKRCNRILTNKVSIKLGYGLVCYHKMQLQEAQITSPNNDVIAQLFDRVRKLELDNTFMKYQLKHKVFVGKSQESDLNWDIPEEIKEIKNESKITFNVVVKELRVIFTEDFDYHNVLKPINPIEQPEVPPQVIELFN